MWALGIFSFYSGERIKSSTVTLVPLRAMVSERCIHPRRSIPYGPIAVAALRNNKKGPSLRMALVAAVDCLGCLQCPPPPSVDQQAEGAHAKQSDGGGFGNWYAVA